MENEQFKAKYLDGSGVKQQCWSGLFDSHINMTPLMKAEKTEAEIDV